MTADTISPDAISADVLDELSEGIAELVALGFDADLIAERIDRAGDATGLSPGYPTRRAFRVPAA